MGDAANAHLFAPSGTSPGVLKWSPVHIQSTGLSVSGGYLGKKILLPVTTKTFQVAGKDATFVLVSKNESGLLRAAGGVGTPRGAFTRIKAIDTLRQKVIDAEEKRLQSAETRVQPPVVEEPAETEVDDDPMNQLDSIEKKEDASAAKKPRKGPYVKKKKLMHAVEMPVLPLGHCQGKTVSVQVVLDGVSTYIIADAVPWFVAYVADEHAHGGIPDEGDDESAVAEGNSSVPGLRIQWDFQDDDGFVGTFVSGPLCSQVIQSKVSTVTEAKWETAKTHNVVSGSFDSASFDDKKKVVWLCIELHGQQRLDDIDASGN